jgi:hypothetical protein
MNPPIESLMRGLLKKGSLSLDLVARNPVDRIKNLPLDIFGIYSQCL